MLSDIQPLMFVGVVILVLGLLTSRIMGKD
jgi:hypothetical protein